MPKPFVRVGTTQAVPVPSTVRILILGAGPTGIGAANYLNRIGLTDWVLVDAANGPGGMAMTEVDGEGFRWDLGGHVIHSHYESFDSALALHSNWESPHRGGWVRVKETWCPTPIQRNLGSLAEGEQIAQELSSDYNAKSDMVIDLQSYFKAMFGNTLNNIFFSPFNQKQWGCPLSDLSHSWTSLRSGSKAQNVPAPRKTAMLAIRTAPEDTSPFPYPTLGTGSLWESIAGNLPAHQQLYNTTITRIDLEDKVAHLCNGAKIQFERCLSTIPLTSLLRLVSHQRPDLAVYRKELRYTSTVVVGFGFEGRLPPILEGKTWIFSADSSVAFHRASIPTNFSESLSGVGRWSIMFETSVSKKRNLDLSGLVDAHLAELKRWGIHEKPISIWQRHLKLGYPLPFIGRDELLERLLPAFEEHGVFPRGRFGGWRYESSNQDYAFAQGVEAAQFFHTGRRETVYWPDRRKEPEFQPMHIKRAESSILARTCSPCPASGPKQSFSYVYQELMGIGDHDCAPVPTTGSGRQSLLPDPAAVNSECIASKPNRNVREQPIAAMFVGLVHTAFHIGSDLHEFALAPEISNALHLYSASFPSRIRESLPIPYSNTKSVAKGDSRVAFDIPNPTHPTMNALSTLFGLSALRKKFPIARPQNASRANVQPSSAAEEHHWAQCDEPLICPPFDVFD